MSDLILRIEHIRGSKLCMSGARDWFESHGLSWSEFLENGFPIEQIRRLNDPLSNRVIEFAERMEAANGRQQ